MTNQMILATVSGSFRRHMPAVERAVAELSELGVHVLSPADPRIVDARGEFYFVASDRNRSIRLTQDRHLECIAASQFLWLVSPDGYIGQSASMEVGYAIGLGIPIYGFTIPADLTLARYVRQVPSYNAAVRAVLDESRTRRQAAQTFLIDPYASLNEGHRALENIAGLLKKPAAIIDDAVARSIRAEQRHVTDIFRGRGTREQ